MSLTRSTVRLGLERFLADDRHWKAFHRIGLVTSDAARLPSSNLAAREALLKTGAPIVRLFTPEHGLTAAGPDGAPMPDSHDPLTGLPVTSLYGPRLEPAIDALGDLDAVVFDLQDIGIRFYTFIWTLFHLMAACNRAGRPLIVLDRPNPLGGGPDRAEGPLLDAARHGSFLGRYPLPVSHGLTCGELANLWQQEVYPGLDLRIVRLDGWDQRRPWRETGLPFYPPSPGIPSFESAFFYGSTAFFEATNLSVARGTPVAFQAVGAPWFRRDDTIRTIQTWKIRGLKIEPVSFCPSVPPYEDQGCKGIRLLMTGDRLFKPVFTALHLLAAVISIHRDHFEWRPYPTAANPRGENHFERLIGVDTIRPVLEANAEQITSAQVASWTSAGDWAGRSREALLYD